jgi:hypothetical protein
MTDPVLPQSEHAAVERGDEFETASGDVCWPRLPINFGLLMGMAGVRQ